MVKSDGAIYIETLVDTDGFGKGMTSVEKRMGNLSGAVKKLGIVIGAVFAVQKLVEFGKQAVELGSDLQEVQNVVDVTFTTMSEQVNEFSRSAVQSAGLSEIMAKKYAGTFGAMAKAFGFAESEAYKMSTSLTQLAGDVASFYNITQDEAYTKLKSVFSGETETLKDLGIVMTQTALDSFAMSQGLGMTTRQMTEQQKVSLRYAFVMQQLSDVQGDFVRTSASWANQTRILSLTFDTLKANVGQALIAIFTPFLQVVNQIVAKMAELSYRFLAFVQLITGSSTSIGGSSGQALGDIASGYDTVTNSANKASKAQKNFTNKLDELNILNPMEEIGSGGAIAGSLILPEQAEKEENVLTETSEILDKIKERLKELSDLFKRGFFDGLGEVSGRIQTIKDSIESIKKSFEAIFDEELVTSFNDMLDQIAYSSGQVLGAFASVGLSIGANIIGGIAKYLESDSQRIKNFLINMFDVTNEIFSLVGRFTDAVAFIFESIASDVGQQVTANFIGIFSEIFMAIVETAGNILKDVTRVIAEPFIHAKDEIKKAVDDLLVGLSSITTFLKALVTDIHDFVMMIYEGVIQPIFDNLIERLTELLENNLSPFFSQVGELLTVMGEALLLLWESILSPLLAWLVENILPVIVPIINTIVNQVKTAVAFISDSITAVIKALTGIITFMTGVFTLNWSKAWQGIKDILKSVVNGMATLIEFFVNSAINAINGLIGGINKLTGVVGIPSIPTIQNISIPKLATGAVIPPNAPFLAMLGDQKHGNNIEAPEDLIRKIVREESGLNSDVISLLSEIVRNTRETAEKEFGLSIDGRELVNAYDERKTRNGYAF